MSLFAKPKPNIVIADCSRSCTKENCPKWVVLDQTVKLEDGTEKVNHEGKCCHAWQVIVATEQVQTVKFLLSELIKVIKEK